ncbi:MAG: hypothetical protein K5930_03970, partial [Treponemataceae bacterium]|nr:hypothetical protein [Treponemataceae bacterium]
DSTGKGSSQQPYATVSKALEAIKSINSVDTNYIIHISGTINDQILLTTGATGTLGAFTNSTLTIKGSDKASDKLDGSDKDSLLRINCANTVILENLTITGLSSGTYAGSHIDNSSADVTIKNCDVTGNTYTGSSTAGTAGIYNNGRLTIEDSSIQSNSIQSHTASTNGAGIYNAGTLNIKGTVNVTGNTKGTGTNEKANNLYLLRNKTVTLAEGFDGSSRLGITTEVKPRAGSSVVFTSDFDENSSSITPSTIFSSDEGYAVINGTGDNEGEAVLANGGGTYDLDLPTGNLSFTLKDAVTNGNNVTTFTVGQSKDLYVTAISGTGDEADVIAPAQITYSFQFKCGSQLAETLQSTVQGNTVKVTIPDTISYPDTYRLYITARYNAVTYSASFNLEGVD